MLACVIAPSDRHLLESLLTALSLAEHRLSPACFTDAPSALVTMRHMAVKPRIVLLQTCAPGLEDTAAVKAIRRQTQGQPILTISREMSSAQLLGLIRHGAAGCVSASASTDEMADAIRQVLNGQFPVSPAFAGHLFRLAGSPLFESADRPCLSKRELETLHQLSSGHTYAETAAILGISLSTVQTHVRSIYNKLGCRTLIQALNAARQHSLI